VLGDGTMEKVRCGIDNLLRFDSLERFQGFFINASIRQGLGIGEPEVGAKERRLLGILDQRRNGCGCRAVDIASLGKQLGRLGVSQSESVGNLVKCRPIAAPDCLKSLAGLVVGLAGGLKPSEGVP